jgi:hypothetical protein
MPSLAGLVVGSAPRSKDVDIHAATPHDPETISSPILHSRAPTRPHPADRSSNCSAALAPSYTRESTTLAT